MRDEESGGVFSLVEITDKVAGVQRSVNELIEIGRSHNAIGMMYVLSL
jgi:hypothetical protein